MADARVRALVDRCFPTSDGTLRFGERPVTELAEEFGTPLYVYDRSVMAASYRRLRDALHEKVEICYSIKANPNLAVIECFVGLGARLEIASDGELLLALRAGCAPGRIVFAGPGKTEREIEAALRAGIGEIHVESEREVGRIAACAAALGTTARVAIRVNPGAGAQGGAMQMGGKPAPFGIDEERLDDVVALVVSQERLELTGVHIFAGTQILDHRILVAQYTKCIEIAERVAELLGAPVSTVDFGGGLGIPYFDGEEPLDIAAYRDGIAELIRTALSSEHFAGTRFLVEPGRYLAGEGGVYVARVTDVKRSRDKTFAVIDGGMHHHLAASGNLGQVIKRNFPVALVERLDERDSDAVDVVGPLCTPLDVLARNVPLPEVRVGDLVGVFQSGAYGRSASPTGFLSRGGPAEVWVDGHEATLVRRADRPEDLDS